jgi:RNA polymerase sigma-70 factor (ECF subfamily)
MKNLKSVIQRAQKHEQKAFNDIFNFYWDYLYGFLLKRTSNEELAEEISIRAFARAFDRIKTFDFNYEFKTWLLTISKNIHNDLLREENKISAIKTFSYDNANQLADVKTNPSPEDILITSQNLAILLNTIKSLKDDYRRVLQLRFFDDLSYKEISIRLNQPINTIKVKILRAKNLLSQKIKNERS